MSSLFVQMACVVGYLQEAACMVVCVCVCLCVLYNVTLISAGRAIVFVVLCMQILYLYDFLYFQ